MWIAKFLEWVKSGSFRLVVCFLKIFLHVFLLPRALVYLASFQIEPSVWTHFARGPQCCPCCAGFRYSRLESRREARARHFCPNSCIRISACLLTQYSLKQWSRSGSSSLGSSSISDLESASPSMRASPAEGQPWPGGAARAATAP